MMQILNKEQSCENLWPLHMEKDMELLEQYCSNEDEFLRDILLLQQEEPIIPLSLTDENEQAGVVKKKINNNNNTATSSSTLTVAGGATATTMAARLIRPSSSSSQRTYMISFDKSTTLSAVPERMNYLQLQQQCPRSAKSNSPLSSKKRNLENNYNLNLELESSAAARGEKKTRSDSQNMNHIMSERKRRQELTHKFVALSATIPGLKKTDKNSIVEETIDYVKHLQERVMELEQRNKRSGKEPMTSTTLNNEKNTTTNILRANGGYTTTMNLDELMLPDVKAKVLEKEILVEIITCEKKNGIINLQLKIFDLLQKVLHLFISGCSVFPFGNSAVAITIIAQMGTAYKMTMIDLVENVRQLLMNDVIQSSN